MRPSHRERSEGPAQAVRSHGVEPARATVATAPGPRTANLATLQGVLNGGPRARDLAAYQEMANRGARARGSGAIQRAAGPGAAPQTPTDAPVSAKASPSGLPGRLKAGVESLSGMSMDHVRVHRNSPRPAQLQAHAFAQGSDIHLGPGQEKHLPHEAWHVVQQAQGRVRPTLQMAAGVALNDDQGLEREADRMGAQAMQVGARHQPAAASLSGGGSVAQPRSLGGQSAI